jgi:hypothetical protein
MHDMIASSLPASPCALVDVPRRSPSARPYRSPSLALDYMEAELPQTLAWRAATWPVSSAISAWILSLRHASSVRVEGAPHRGPAVYVTWHRYSPLAFALLPPRVGPIVVLGGTAPHVRVFRYTARLTGLGLVPGTSGHRGQQALDQLAVEIEQGASVLMMVDGPRGPAYRAKPGCVRLAGAAGVPIVPVALGGRGFSDPRNWDRMHLPWPVNRFALRFGEPIRPGEDMEAALAEVDGQLHDLHASIGMEG